MRRGTVKSLRKLLEGISQLTHKMKSSEFSNLSTQTLCLSDWRSEWGKPGPSIKNDCCRRPVSPAFFTTDFPSSHTSTP